MEACIRIINVKLILLKKIYTIFWGEKEWLEWDQRLLSKDDFKMTWGKYGKISEIDQQVFYIILSTQCLKSTTNIWTYVLFYIKIMIN